MIKVRSLPVFGVAFTIVIGLLPCPLWNWRSSAMLPTMAGAEEFNRSDDHTDIGVETVAKKKYPWLGVLQEKGTGRVVCTTAFIGTRFLVTAEHCIVDNRPEDYEAVVGFLCSAGENDDCNEESARIEIKKNFPNPSGGDMTILELKRHAPTYIQPAIPFLGKKYNIEQQKLKENTELNLVGTGASTFDGPSAEWIAKMTVTTISEKQCREKIRNHPEVEASALRKTTVCSTPEDSSLPCKSDAGAALVTGGNGIWEGSDVVMAIHNFGPSTCDLNTTAAAPVLGHFSMKEAEEHILDRVCDSKFPPSWCDTVLAFLVSSTLTPASLAPSTEVPTSLPKLGPTIDPTGILPPTISPTGVQPPTISPTTSPTSSPSDLPTSAPTTEPTSDPTKNPTRDPSLQPTRTPCDISKGKRYDPEKRKCVDLCKANEGRQFDKRRQVCVGICAEDMAFDEQKKTCQCIGENQKKKNGECTCKSKFVRDVSGDCVLPFVASLNFD